MGLRDWAVGTVFKKKRVIIKVNLPQKRTHVYKALRKMRFYCQVSEVQACLMCLKNNRATVAKEWTVGG